MPPKRRGAAAAKKPQKASKKRTASKALESQEATPGKALPAQEEPKAKRSRASGHSAVVDAADRSGGGKSESERESTSGGAPAETVTPRESAKIDAEVEFDTAAAIAAVRAAGIGCSTPGSPIGFGLGEEEREAAVRAASAAVRKLSPTVVRLTERGSFGLPNDGGLTMSEWHIQESAVLGTLTAIGEDETLGVRVLVVDTNHFGSTVSRGGMAVDPAFGALVSWLGSDNGCSVAELRLENGKMTCLGKELLAALCGCQTLKILSLNQQSLREGSPDFADKEVGTLLLAKGSALEELSMCDNPHLAGPFGLKMTGKALCSNTTLRKLDVSRCILKYTHVKFLIDALYDNEVLETLVLSGNPIGARGISDLSGSLQSNTTLTRLEMDDCDVNDKAAIELAAVLDGEQNGPTHNPVTSLRWVSLARNPLTAPGFHALAALPLSVAPEMGLIYLSFERGANSLSSIPAEALQMVDSGILRNRRKQGVEKEMAGTPTQASLEQRVVAEQGAAAEFRSAMAAQAEEDLGLL